MIKTFPTLYKRTSTGAIQTWEIEVETPDGHHDHMDFDPATIVTRWGQKDGAIQEARDIIMVGKNIGKANETTPFEQACAEAQSTWEKKGKRHYVQTLEAAEAGEVDTDLVQGGVAPMLAHDFAKQGHKITYPAYVQPKLDGHRCIAVIEDGVCTLWSRTQKPITGVPHIQRELERVFVGRTITLDGELYNHDYKNRFEELTSFIRNPSPKAGHEAVQYHVYDIVDKRPQNSRTMDLEWLEGNSIAVRVPHVTVSSEDEMMLAVDDFLGQGYEGGIARNANGLYKHGRSYDLQKIKTFDDAEFEVVGIEEGRGKFADQPIFTLVTETGEEFRCRIIGDLVANRKYLLAPNEWIGKMMTVKYFGITNKSSVPRFPVGLRLREDV